MSERAKNSQSCSAGTRTVERIVLLLWSRVLGTHPARSDSSTTRLQVPDTLMLYEDYIDMKLCSTYGGCDSSSNSELLAARCVDSNVVLI
jgi:hypothetical protein